MDFRLWSAKVPWYHHQDRLLLQAEVVELFQIILTIPYRKIYLASDRFAAKIRAT